MKATGWMVNFAMRRVEPVMARESHLNRHDYGLYQGPRRTYMLHDCQVYDSELAAMESLHRRMAFRLTTMIDAAEKYKTELLAVRGALKRIMEGA